MNYGNNMDPDIEKLIKLFKKIMKKDPKTSEQLSKMLDNKAINVNLCFITFLPMSADDLDEFNEIYEDVLNRTEDGIKADTDSELEFELTLGDLDFLKKNGIEF